jgi:hypothetical protein
MKRALLIILYWSMAVLVTALSGCASLTPTRVPPLSKALGYEIPNYKGWTVTGLNEGKYRIECEKLKVLRTMVNVVNEPALAAREQAVDWLNVGLSAGMFGGLPLAWRRDPNKRKA